MHSVLITHALKLWSENTDTSQCMCGEFYHTVTGFCASLYKADFIIFK